MEKESFKTQHASCGDTGFFIGHSPEAPSGFWWVFQIGNWKLEMSGLFFSKFYLNSERCLSSSTNRLQFFYQNSWSLWCRAALELELIGRKWLISGRNYIYLEIMIHLDVFLYILWYLQALNSYSTFSSRVSGTVVCCRNIQLQFVIIGL